MDKCLEGATSVVTKIVQTRSRLLINLTLHLMPTCLKVKIVLPHLIIKR